MTKDKFLASVILLFGTTLLQIHSIKFWTSIVGNETGILWSLLLEIVALWLWTLTSLKHRILGGLTTVVLLAGPLYDVGYPILKQHTAQTLTFQAAAAEIEQKQELLDLKKESLRIFLENSRDRTGWHTKIAQVESDIEILVVDINGLKKRLSQKLNNGDLDFQKYLVIMLQIISVVIFQFVNVVAINRLFAKRERETNSLVAGSQSNTKYCHSTTDSEVEATSKPVLIENPSLADATPLNEDSIDCHMDKMTLMTTKDQKMTVSDLENCHLDMNDIKSALKKKMTTQKLTALELSKQSGIARQYISYLLNFDKSAKSTRVPPKAALTKLVSYLGDLHMETAR